MAILSLLQTRFCYNLTGIYIFSSLTERIRLFYWDNKQWTSAGRQSAATGVLTFTDVPSGMLYWLHNHTRGKEERIFTYEDGKQVWW